jgi:hypothetical protein
VASFEAIAAVSRTLRRLLLDRMATPGAAVTLVPPDIRPAGMNGARVNLYLFQVRESAILKNQPLPGAAHPAVYGTPPLSLDLTYLLTTYPRTEDQAESDLMAQSLLGDAMLVLHDFGSRIETLALVTNRAGAIGDRLLDPVLVSEFERVKLSLDPSGIDELSKLWSALPQANFRRSQVYTASVVQLEARRPRRSAPPVAVRRILASVAHAPQIETAYRTPPPPPGDQLRDLRIAIGESLTIEHGATAPLRLYVRLGTLDPIRIALPSGGRIVLPLPDGSYPIDLDHAAVRPIPAEQLLQPGALEVQLLSIVDTDGVEGAFDRGVPVTMERALRSNIALVQLAPSVSAVTPAFGTGAAMLRLTGTRLWASDLPSEVVVGDAVIPVRVPGPGDGWAMPTPLQVEVPVSAVAAVLPPRAAPYRVAAQVNGVRSRETGLSFRLDP